MGVETPAIPCENCPARLADLSFYDENQRFLDAGKAAVEIADDGSLGASYSPKTRHPSDRPTKISFTPEDFANEYPNLHQSIHNCTGQKIDELKGPGLKGFFGLDKEVKPVCSAIHKELGFVVVASVKKYFAKDLGY